MSISTEANSLRQTVEALSDEASYGRLFHSSRDEEALPSSENLKRIIDLCRAILFPGYYGSARINKQTIRFHTGVAVETLHSLLSKEIHAGICFADQDCLACSEEERNEQAVSWHIPRRASISTRGRASGTISQ